MLNARYAIVGFTERDQEMAELAGWRDARESRLAGRWLHAPGGQGKTRLSIAFAHHSVGENWKVITAVHGAGSVLPSPGAQDLRLNDLRGVLLIVDYADRWPASHLASLFTNALLHQHVPARLLLIARTADAWPAVRASLETHQADCSEQVLAPLPDEPNGRQRMFTVARNAFAGHYRISDPSVIQHPGTLDGADFGLTLAVHMAALAAVDAAARDVAAARPGHVLHRRRPAGPLVRPRHHGRHRRRGLRELSTADDQPSRIPAGTVKRSSYAR